MAEFWLVRHARTVVRAGVIAGHDAPVDLTASEAFAWLGAVLPPDVPAVCSPAVRTVQTARALDLHARPDPALREQDFGDWTGRRHADLELEDRDRYADFWRSPGTNRPPRGESFAEQVSRTERFFEEFSGGPLVAVVHSGTVRALLAVALGLEPKRALSFVIDNLSLTRIDRIGREWRVNFVNALARSA